MSATLVAAIVVSYNVRELLLNGLASLDSARAQGLLQEIIVVDSASSDGSPDAVRDRFPEIRVIEAPNRGYGAGANLGMAATHAGYTLILNPDTVVPPATIQRLKTYLDEHPDVGVCAPRLRYPGGQLQPSRRRFPGRLTPVFESTVLQQWWPSNPWSRDYYVQDIPENAIQDVDWVVGACLLVRRAVIANVGGFDESFWMYCEEIEWCWRLQRHGWKTVYIPDVEIVHYEGASTSQDVPQRQLAFDRSRIELQRRLYGKPTAVVVQAGIKIGYLVQMSIESAKWLLGHRRAMRRRRVAFYRTLLLSNMSFRENQCR